VALLEGISDRRILFGSLRVTPDVNGYPYSVVLNDEPIGSTTDVYTNDRIIADTYELAVVQQRPTGPEVIERMTVSIDPNGTTEVGLTMPIIRPEEVEYLRDHLPPADDLTRPLLFGDIWDAAGRRDASEQFSELAGGGVFPAREAIRQYYADSADLASRSAAWWTGGAGESGTITVPSRTITVGNGVVDWFGIPAMRLEPLQPTVRSGVSSWRVALDPSAEEIYLLFESEGGPIPATRTFRLSFAPGDGRFPAAGAFELELSPEGDRGLVTARVWDSSDTDDYEELDLEAWTASGQGAFEAVVDVEDFAIVGGFSVGVEVVEDGTALARSVPDRVRALPSLQQRTSDGFAPETAIARLGATGTGRRFASPLAEELLGAFY
jgi:hypothetical protein